MQHSGSWRCCSDHRIKTTGIVTPRRYFKQKHYYTNMELADVLCMYVVAQENIYYNILPIVLLLSLFKDYPQSATLLLSQQEFSNIFLCPYFFLKYLLKVLLAHNNPRKRSNVWQYSTFLPENRSKYVLWAVVAFPCTCPYMKFMFQVLHVYNKACRAKSVPSMNI